MVMVAGNQAGSVEFETRDEIEASLDKAG